jgi:hypothetical protein
VGSALNWTHCITVVCKTFDRNGFQITNQENDIVFVSTYYFRPDGGGVCIL